MRRLCVALTIGALALAGCGGDDEGGGGGADTGTATEEQTATTQEQTTETATTETETTEQASAEGRRLFTENCAGCHALADADANSQQAPNLDEVRPAQEAVERQVTNGGGGMPAFRDRLSAEQITAVSEYVASVAGK